MTRLLQPPVTISVWAVDGRPAYITWDGRRYRVETVVLRWRVRVWWREVWREYYKLVLDGPDIVLVVVYADLLEERWYLQQVYD